MDNALKKITEHMEAQLPLAFKAALPRSIQPPTGFCNPKYYAAQTVGNVMVVQNPAMNQLPHMTAYMTAISLIANKVPTYFVAYEFAQAVANTDLPLDFKFSEIKWPMEALLFVLPDQFVMSYFGCYAPFIALARCKSGMHPANTGKLPQIEIPYTDVYNQVEKFMVDYPIYHNQGVPTDYNGSYPTNAGIEIFKTAQWVDSTKYEDEMHGFTLPADWTDLTPEQEQVFIDKALALSMKLIMAVSCRPGLVENGHCTRPLKMRKDKVVQKELWSPNVIGRTYKIPRQLTGPISTGRNKPRFTFRRGHYTWQAKRFKDVEFVSVEQMPRDEKGTINFDAAGNDLSGKFRAVHERLWVEGILFGNEEK